MKKFLAILAAIALVGAFSASAMAADWSFYGSARMTTFVNSYDFGDSRNAAGDDDDTDLTWAVQGNSRIGANVKADKVTGRFEYGTGVNLRLLYGVWDFGSGKLLAGQDYTPITSFWSNQVWGSDNDVLGEGNAYGGRVGQLKLMFGDFQIAALTPTTSAIGSGGDVDTYLPKIEAAFKTKVDKFKFEIFGGLQAYDIDLVADSIDVTSYCIGVGGSYDFGAAYLNAQISFYQNGLSAGWSGGGSATLNAARNDVDDQDTWMGTVILGFKASDMVTFEAGLGYRNIDSDVAGSENDDQWVLYLNSTLTLAPGVFVVPEIGYYDYQDGLTGADEGSLFYVGAKWQINF